MVDQAPARLQRTRQRGFSMRGDSLFHNGLPAASVARPGPLGNPFKVGEHGDAAECVDLFQRLLTEPGFSHPDFERSDLEAARSKILDRLPDLRGHNLYCFCAPGAPCHGDVLLEMAHE